MTKPRKFKRTDSNVEVVYMGIDPGATGSYVFINRDQRLYGIRDWMGDEFAVARQLEDFIESIKAEVDPFRLQIRAALEKQQGRPLQGTNATFNSGMNYGIWRGLLCAMKIPFTLITPQKWQVGIPNVRKGGKLAIAQQAQRLFPDAAVYGPRGGLLDGRSDALMIAEWLRCN